MSKSKQPKDTKLQEIEKYLLENYDMRFNTILGLPEKCIKASGTGFEVMNENSIFRELEHQRFKTSVNTVKSLLKSDFLLQYNPIKSYFDSLEPYTNTEPDYIGLVTKYVSVFKEDKVRFETQLRKFLVRSVACTLNGVTNKQCLVLVSPKQNCGKSTFCRWLCPPELSEHIIENINTDKDSLISLTENFIINMDELSTLNKADLNALKSLMSQDKIKCRKPYDSKALRYERIANFIGSTNSVQFLTDETGTVRWLCFEIDTINFDYKKDLAIDRIWAQALFLLKSGFKYQLTPEEIQQNEISNTKYRQNSLEFELIQETYMPAEKDDFNSQFLTPTQIQGELMKKHISASKVNTVNIGKALHLLGFKREIKRQGNSSRYGYYVKPIE